MKYEITHPQKEVAVFGGSFNPPTVAHEAVIQACLNADFIDEVWVMPSRSRTDKTINTDGQSRTQMLELLKAEAFEADDRLLISDIELHLPRPTMTARTVGALALAYPTVRFWFVFGTDAFLSMPEWKDGVRLQSELPILLVERGKKIHCAQSNVFELSIGDHAEVSSTQVRNAVQSGKDIRAFVCPSVEKYIRNNNLYVYV